MAHHLRNTGGQFVAGVIPHMLGTGGAGRGAAGAGRGAGGAGWGPAPAPAAPGGPFPRFGIHSALTALTWDQCFAFSRNDIARRFVNELINNIVDQASGIRKIASLLKAMMEMPPSVPASAAVMANMTASPRYPQFPNITPLNAPGAPGIGWAFWQPAGTSAKLRCYTMFDLLAACMVEAMFQQDLPAPRTRDFYSRMVSLYSHWCAVLHSGAQRPAMVSIAWVGKITIMGSTLTQIPGPGMDNAKVTLQRERRADLERLGPGNGQRYNVTEPHVGGQRYGNCAETFSFAVISILSQRSTADAQGIAIEPPDPRRTRLPMQYNEAQERARHAMPCTNCARMLSEIAKKQGQTAEAYATKIRQNFSV